MTQRCSLSLWVAQGCPAPALAKERAKARWTPPAAWSMERTRTRREGRVVTAISAAMWKQKKLAAVGLRQKQTTVIAHVVLATTEAAGVRRLLCEKAAKRR